MRPICEAVRHRGAEALYELGERFDGVRPAAPRVPSEVLAAALSGLTHRSARPSRRPSAGPRLVHEDQRRAETTTEVVEGGTVTALGAGRPRGAVRPRGPRSTPRAS